VCLHQKLYSVREGQHISAIPCCRRCSTNVEFMSRKGVLSRDGHETSLAETETLASPAETRPRRLQVSRRDRDVEIHVVINAVVNKLT